MRKRRTIKPAPYKWICNEHGVVEFYDFQLYKISNPPDKDHEPVLLSFPRE